jgi:molybdopterin-containing oxidoreductase family iron-sulfur binding subunit
MGRSIRDGEVLTACQSVCPTDSIVFGNLNDPNSRVSQLKRSPRNYAMLDELNTRPRTTYLAAVRNPHPSLPHNLNVGGHDTDHDSGAGAGEQH